MKPHEKFAAGMALFFVVVLMAGTLMSMWPT